MKNTIVGLKELRKNMDVYINQVAKGRSFIIVRRSKPVLKISSPVEEGLWESVIDFTKLRKGGVLFSDLLTRL